MDYMVYVLDYRHQYVVIAQTKYKGDARVVLEKWNSGYVLSKLTNKRVIEKNIKET